VHQSPRSLIELTFNGPQGAEDVGGRSHGNVVCFLAAVPAATQPCSRVVQLLLLYAFLVMFTAFAVAGAGAVHSKSRHKNTRYQRGKASSIHAFVMADHFGDGRLSPNEVRTFDCLNHRGADERSADDAERAVGHENINTSDENNSESDIAPQGSGSSKDTAVGAQKSRQ